VANWRRTRPRTWGGTVFAGVSEFPARVTCARLAWHALKGTLVGDGTVSTEWTSGGTALRGAARWDYMQPADDGYEPMVGYNVLEQSRAAVNTLGKRLVPIKHLDRT
jgi:hypothetical protein